MVNARGLTVLDTDKLPDAKNQDNLPGNKLQHDRVWRLNQANLAQEFAEQISTGRLIQIQGILDKTAQGHLHPVEALFKIREVVNRND